MGPAVRPDREGHQPARTLRRREGREDPGRGQPAQPGRQPRRVPGGTPGLTETPQGRADVARPHHLPPTGATTMAGPRHGPRVTAVQMRTRRSDVEPDLATVGPGKTAEGGVSDRRAQELVPTRTARALVRARQRTDTFLQWPPGSTGRRSPSEV